MLRILALFLAITFSNFLQSQEFYFGADQSYVKELEDCGVVYKEDGIAKDVYDIYQDHGSNLVRLRLWHTPKWYDGLNQGKRYSNLADVKKAIKRAKEHDMDVLLNFHLSDNWADPSKQLVPEAWLSVVNNLPLLEDSLYNYITATLVELKEEDLLPEMVQIGNETNKGILLSPEDNAVWTLDWTRNAKLFNQGIKAVRDVNESIKIMIHAAGPDNTVWLMEQFHENGVLDFDVIGISYYWAWHKPITIAETGDIIEDMISKYDKEVIIAETGYIWTTASNDEANNIISEIDESYGPASPESQKQWLIDLTTEVIDAGGSGVIYWEPSWVSSNCFTQWGRGSHQEHATFFDFDNNLINEGGIGWMEHDYGLSSTNAPKVPPTVDVKYLSDSKMIRIYNHDFIGSEELSYRLVDTSGVLVSTGEVHSKEQLIEIDITDVSVLIVSVYKGNSHVVSEKILIR